MGVVTASVVRRLRVRPARAAEAVEQGPRVRQRLPVLRLVLRGQHRPDLHPARHARPQRRAGHRAGRRPGRGRRRPGGRSARAPRWSSPAASTRSLCPWGWVAQLAGGRLSAPATTRPAAYLPFDRDAQRLRAGRGRRDPRRWRTPSARRAARRAAVYGEIAGYAATFDPRAGPRPAARPAPGRRAGAGRRRAGTRRHRRGLRRRRGRTGAGPGRGRGDHRRCSARAACRSPRPRP